MIYFNKETRQFGTANLAGVTGALGYGGYQDYRKQKEIDRLINEGKTPEEAKKIAKAKFGKTSGNLAKGYMAGRGVHYIGKRVGKLTGLVK